MQYANPPGRNEPGVGDLDFGPLCTLLDEQANLKLARSPSPSPSPSPNPNPNQGYEGHVGLEYKPSTQATAQSFAGWGAAHGIA